jgi:anti-sigma B factor antagonist
MMASSPSDLSVRHVGGATVVEFLDRRLIDASHIEQIGAQILAIVDAAVKPRLVISFEKVEYLSSTALNVLIELDNAIRHKKGQLRLAHLDPELQKVFTLMKLHKVLKICKTTDEALKSMK